MKFSMKFYYNFVDVHIFTSSNNISNNLKKKHNLKHTTWPIYKFKNMMEGSKLSNFKGLIAVLASYVSRSCDFGPLTKIIRV